MSKLEWYGGTIRSWSDHIAHCNLVHTTYRTMHHGHDETYWEKWPEMTQYSGCFTHTMLGGVATNMIFSHRFPCHHPSGTRREQADRSTVDNAGQSHRGIVSAPSESGSGRLLRARVAMAAQPRAAAAEGPGAWVSGLHFKLPSRSAPSCKGTALEVLTSCAGFDHSFD